MEQDRDSQPRRAHEAIERDAYARYDRLAEGIELSYADRERVDGAVRAVRENGYAVVTGFLDGARTRRAREELAAVFELPDDLVIRASGCPPAAAKTRSTSATCSPVRARRITSPLSWLRQQENQYLGIPREVMAGLPELLQRLLGYNRSPFGGVSGTSSLDYFRNHYT